MSERAPIIKPSSYKTDSEKIAAVRQTLTTYMNKLPNRQLLEAIYMIVKE